MRERRINRNHHALIDARLQAVDDGVGSLRQSIDDVSDDRPAS